MQQGLDWIALRAHVMQSLALEQPVELDLALRSVGAEVEARHFANKTTCAFCQAKVNVALERAGRPFLRIEAVGESCNSPYDTAPKLPAPH